MEEAKVRKHVRPRAPATRKITFGRWFGIVLPEGAKADQVKAEFQDGVLTVSVPVPEAEKIQAPVHEGSKAAQETPESSLREIDRIAKNFNRKEL